MSRCAFSQHQQVSGGACSLTMYMEAAPGCVEPGTKGTILAFMSETFSRGTSKHQRSVITGKRGPGKPFEGLPQMTGAVQAAAYSPQIGYLMRALCGPPLATAPDPERSLGAAAAVELDMGIVGLPCPKHGFVQDAVITVHGTQNYDGQYRVARGVSRDIIAIAAPYVAEVLPAGAKVWRGRAPLLQGEAVNLGSGAVGLPTKGMHALHEGESIRITGSMSYDGTYVLKDGSADDLLIIAASYAPETFDGTLAAVPLFFSHSFALPKRQPTICMEKYLDYDPDVTANRYQRFGFCKVNGLSFNFGGDEELIFAMDFAVGRQEEGPAPLDPAAVEPPGIPMDNIECALWVAGVRRGDVESGSFNNAFGIEPKAAVGDLAQYSRMPEGDPECTATLNAFLEEIDYQELSRNRTTVPFSLSICSFAGDEAWFHYPETELDTPGEPITGKEGLMQEVTVMAFVHRSDTVLSMELINRIQSYA